MIYATSKFGSGPASGGQGEFIHVLGWLES